jgi:predicted phage baseplate assembly protein
MLPVGGPIDLVDSGGTPYLRVEARSPLAWPPAFAVMVQGNQTDPEQFNLIVVYDPPSGEGVALPVLVERFDAVTLANVAQTFAAASTLLAVRSFEDEPNPSLSASALMATDPNQALAKITLTGTLDDRVTEWLPLPNLLHAGPQDARFVVEVEFDGTAILRLGDGTNGLAPESLTSFDASYRVGNGTAGNVGAESLIYLAADDARITGCINPLPATGGFDSETAEQIRRRAPAAFETQERAITMEDYADIAERDPRVREAVADLRWTGSWYTVFLAADAKGCADLTKGEQRTLRRFVDRYRLAGQDLEIRNPQFVSLLIELTVCVDPAYFRANVEKMLMQVLGSEDMPDGRKGLFVPDTFAFGQDVYLSPIYKAARSVPGVTSVSATVFRPQDSNDNSSVDTGVIPIGPLQIARMDNDRSFPGHGQLVLKLVGGK